MGATSKTWEEIRAEAQRATDAAFASRISSLTRLTDEEIKSIAPTVVDRERLAHLMTIVTDAKKSNLEKAQAIKNVDGLVEIAVSVISKLA